MLHIGSMWFLPKLALQEIRNCKAQKSGWKLLKCMTIQIHESITGCYESVMWQTEAKPVRDVSDGVTFSAVLCSTLAIHPQKKPQTEQVGMAATDCIRGTEYLHENIRAAWLLYPNPVLCNFWFTHSDLCAASERVIRIVRKSKASCWLWSHAMVLSCNVSF